MQMALYNEPNSLKDEKVRQFQMVGRGCLHPAMSMFDLNVHSGLTDTRILASQ